MGKPKTIDAFFKKKDADSNSSSTSNPQTLAPEQRPSKMPRNESQVVESFDISTLQRDPGLRPQIWEYPINQRDEIRCAYLKLGPYRFIPSSSSGYPVSGIEKNRRRFQSSWYKMFDWLEYSEVKDAAYCLPCFLFAKKPTGRFGSSAFTIDGFRNWKKVNDGTHCSFLVHMGNGPCSPHNNAVKCCDNLKNQSQHIDKVIDKQTSEEKLNNRLRLKASIESIRYLAYQGCAFRGHDEGPDSKNRGNFLELIKVVSYFNEDVAKVVLENAPQNAKYTSHHVQKDILHVLAKRVRNVIRKEIGDSKFCIIVDEARDESMKEQMAIVLRFVDKDGFIQERFFDIVQVKDTSALTLKDKISDVLSQNCLDIQSIRGQGYDGASNMRGEWKGLQALFLNECSCAYYVHCFAHRLQLALVAASREVIVIHQFFSNLNFIINVVNASCKRHRDLQDAQEEDISYLIAIDELETGKGANQIGTLKRAGDTRWSSHFYSISSLLRLFNPTCSVLEKIVKEGSTYSQRGDADVAYEMITSFNFIFILHLMREIMGTTDCLCQHLQQKSQDILSAIQLISNTKALLQKLRNEDWDNFLEKVVSFSKKFEIDIPDLGARYVKGRGRLQRDHITVEHHYHFDVFNATIDFQLQELNFRFGERAIELLTLSSALDPNDAYKSFNIDDICNLAEKYYSLDFSEQEKIILRFQLKHFEVDMLNHPKLQKLSSIAELCRGLIEAGKSDTYYLIDRLIRLVLTLPVSTATTERAFSAMKIVKTRLRNKMEDEFLGDNLLIYIEREIAKSFDSELILDDFVSLRPRRMQF
jgi:hypothetical protein